MFTRAIPSQARSVFLAFIWTLTCSFSLAAQTPRPIATAEPITGSIAGRVVNENGQGVPNAVVYSRALAGSASRLTATDDEGDFKFEGLDSALYSFTVAMPGYVIPPRPPDGELVYYRIGESVTVNLIKGGVITGTVLSLSGDPVTQVGVRAVLVRDANGQSPNFAGFQSQRTTDDRGVYRIYGLLPGTYVVFTGGRNSFGGITAYDNEAPTYAPSSTRDTAALITVGSGEETTVDIKYRGEAGHAVSGTLLGLPDVNVPSSLNVFLSQVVNGASLTMGVTFIQRGTNSFAFYGLADGDYDLKAQTFSAAGAISTSESKRIAVNGADVTGIELSIKPLGSLSGQVVLAKSNLAECKDKRQPLFSETLISLRRSEKEKTRDQTPFSFFAAQGVPNQTGEFQLKNLAPGQYNFGARFFAKYWYLKSVVQQPVTTGPSARTGVPNSQNDLARNGVTLTFGENIARVTVNLAEGAASVRGSVKLETGQIVPPKLLVYLVPAEKESAEDVLRFFASEASPDGAFALSNLPPGRYWAVAQVTPKNEIQSEFKLRSPAETEARAKLRRAAEVGKLSVELKPCQNVVDYQLPVLASQKKIS
ncbi:MAG: carboxypeptidase regulatory-like domain-containing protein [Pyrinomonadaceae bacterium]